MARGDLNRRISVVIDGSQAGQGIAPVTEAIQKLEAKLQGLDKTSKDYDAQVKSITEQLNKKNKTLETYKAKIAETKRVMSDLSGATYKELTAVRDMIKVQLKEVVPGTKRYNDLLKEQKRVTEQLSKVQKDMRTEVGCQGTAFGKAAGFVNKYAMLISGAVASLTGLTMTVRKTVNDYAEMEEAMAQVRKYTGLTKEGVDDLNESLKKMDTRTSRERLNALAGDAGRLGITGKEAILEFVDAADKINVALGEDLGEDAVKNIGKLAQMFGEDKTKGLRGAMLATGSAVNELAQNSSASEPYIVDFTARLAGVAQQAGISQANIMGFASALDQNMQQLETSSTVLSQLITKMFQQPAKFARLAGMEVKEFSDLIASDANAALLRFLETMQKKGGFDSLAPMFQEMKLNGTRAVGVLSTVATHIDQVKAAQDLANQAYDEGTSILNEYNVQNNTVQAGLDKAKKKFHEVSVELGEKLQPLSKKLITGTSATIRILSQLIDFVDKHVSAITIAVSSLTAYTVAVTVSNSRLGVWIKTLRAANAETVLASTVGKAYKATVILVQAALAWLQGDLKKVNTLMRLLNMTIKVNLWGAALAAITAVSVALAAFITRQREVTKVSKEFSGELSRERMGLDNLFDALGRAGKGTQTRRDLIKQINEKYGQYLPNLLTEKSNLDEVNGAYERINASLTEQIALKHKNEEISGVADKEGRQQIDLLADARSRLAGMFGNDGLAGLAVSELKEITKNYYDAGAKWQQAYGSALDTIKRKYFGNKSIGSSAAEDFQKYVESYYRMRKEVSAIDRKYDPWMAKKPENELDEVVVTATRVENTGSQASDQSDDEKADKARKSRLEALKTQYTQLQAEIKKIFAEGNDDMLQTETQYNARLLEAKKDYLEKVKEAAGKGSKEYADAENELADIQLQERKAALEKRIEEENEIYERQKVKLQEDFLDRSNEQIDSQETYNEMLESVELAHLNRMLEIAGLDAETRMGIEQQVRDLKIKMYNEVLKKEEETSKKEVEDAEKKRKKIEDSANKQRATLEGYATSFGDTIGRLIAGEENALRAFSDTMIDIIFDVLQKTIEAEIAEATARAVATEAKAAAEAFATPDSVMSFGASGAARAAVLSALIMGALAAAKATLKGLLGGSRRSSSSAGETTDSPKVYQRVTQHASGRYPVIGEQDGRLYNAPYIGASPTGIVRSPALIAENGAELIVNAEDLQRLQKHMNYPLVLQAIAESRRPQPVVQHASGNYPQYTSPVVASPDGGAAVLQRLAGVLEVMVRNGVKAPVVLSEVEKKQQLRDAARKIGSKIG